MKTLEQPFGPLTEFDVENGSVAIYPDRVVFKDEKGNEKVIRTTTETEYRMALKLKHMQDDLTTTNLNTLRGQLYSVLQRLEARGRFATVSLRPSLPLAMGNYKMVVDIRNRDYRKDKK